jgi:hypothetical protein
MSARLLDLALAIALTLALAGAAQLRAAEWPSVRESDTLWPTMVLDDAQWPDISDAQLKKLSAPATQAPAAVPNAAPASAASIAGPSTPDAVSSEKPILAPTTSLDFAGMLRRFMAPQDKDNDKDKASDDNLTTGASLDVPLLKAPPPPAREIFATRFPSDFSFEGGARYWYSVGQNRFAFTNREFLGGNPSSTLDWDRMQGHSGEGFFRIDHHPTHLYVKGLAGGGILKGGDMDDLDFVGSQINFSNTTSAVDGNNLAYAIIDLGYAFEVPSAGVRYGAFVGYHYWHEKMTAYGLLCNSDQLNNMFACPSPGAVVVPFSTPVDIFDTTWNALRIGGDVKYQINDRWTVSGEVALVPYATVTNKDSHLLRTDLGPVPNIITNGQSAIGGEAEAFVHYKVLPHFELGVGARYWGLYTQSGSVEFGPTFSPDFPLTRFSSQRYGVLFEAKATW